MNVNDLFDTICSVDTQQPNNANNYSSHSFETNHECLCPCCGGYDLTLLYSDGDDGVTWNDYVCNNCKKNIRFYYRLQYDSVSLLFEDKEINVDDDYIGASTLPASCPFGGLSEHDCEKCEYSDSHHLLNGKCEKR